MTEWNGLKFEAKPVPKDWLKELVQLREEASGAQRARVAEGETPSRPVPMPVPSIEEVLSYFETIRSSTAMCEVYKNAPLDPPITPETNEQRENLHLRNSFTEWWIRKYTEYGRVLPSFAFNSVQSPLIAHLRGESLNRTYELIVELVGNSRKSSGEN